MVLASEHRVFKMVNFTVPKGTALDAVEALIAATNLIKRKEEIYAISGELLDLAYLQVRFFNLYLKLVVIYFSHFWMQ